MQNDNTYTVIDGDNAYIEQNIEQTGISTAGSVDQDATNTVDLSNVASTENIEIIQSISQAALADAEVSSSAENLIIGDINGDDVVISQTIDQEAVSCNNFAFQEASNLMDSNLIGDDGNLFQRIFQAAEAEDHVEQHAYYFDPSGPGIFIGNLVGEIQGDGNTVTQEIEQIALSDSSGVNQGTWDFGNIIVSIYGDDNSAIQDLSQVAQAAGDIDQWADWGNQIVFIGDINMNSDYTTVSQSISQIVVSGGAVWQVAANELENSNIMDFFGNDMQIAQEIEQTAIAQGDIEQDIYNHIAGIVVGDDATIIQGLTQNAATGGVAEQYAGDFGLLDPANGILTIVGDDAIVSQVLIQNAIANLDVYQQASVGNGVGFIAGNNAWVGQSISQAGASEDGEVFQIAINGIESVSGDTPVISQSIVQAAISDEVGQMSENAVVITAAQNNAFVFQEIDSTAVWGTALNRMAYNYAPINSDGDATVVQAIDAVSIGTDPFGVGVSIQRNEIQGIVTGAFNSVQNNNAINGGTGNTAAIIENLIL
jgi:hypothetical protein